MIKYLQFLSRCHPSIPLKLPFNVKTHFNGNIDNAYQGGFSDGERRIAQLVLSILQENNNKNE